MRTAITLDEFLFTLNQDEDIRVHLIDYERGEMLYSGWKTDFYTLEHKYDNWFVQHFLLTTEGLEIIIVELPEELDQL